MNTVFDSPAQWRGEVITDLRLRGAERCAAASPAPGFPQLLDSMIRALRHAPIDGVWIDVGAGLGGVADWINRSTRHPVLAFEPSPESTRTARALFPGLAATQALGESLPVVTSGVSGVIVSGVVSLLDDLRAMLGEAARVLRPGGVLAIADIWSTSDLTRREPPNTFWSIESVVAMADRFDLEFHEAAICTIGTGWWPSAAVQVNEVIESEFGDRPGFDAWERDQRLIAGALDGGLVLPGACSFTRRSP